MPAGDGKFRGRVGAGGGCRGRTQSSAGGTPCSALMGPLASVALEGGSRGGLGTFPRMSALRVPCAVQKSHPG